MPTVVTLRVRSSGMRLPETRHLHGLACALFERPEDDHSAMKLFSAWPAARAGDSRDSRGSCLRLRFGWLHDEPPPAIPSTGGSVRLGNTRCVVEEVTEQKDSFGALAAGPPALSGTLSFHSPTYFSSNGEDVRSPDPRLIVGSYRRRWNAAVPGSAPWVVDDDLWQRLSRSLCLTTFDLRTAGMESGHDRLGRGFIGTASLRLRPAVSNDLRAVFAALMRFATYSGTGAQTTHGFGATVSRVPADDHG